MGGGGGRRGGGGAGGGGDLVGDINPRPSSKPNYKILYFNSYSILSKIELLRAEALLLEPDVILIAESFCRADITDAYLSIAGYQTTCRRDGRDTAGGRGRGLLIYVREGISAAELVLEGGDLVTE